MGIQRSLSSDEIIAQLFWAKKICRLYHLPKVTNVSGWNLDSDLRYNGKTLFLIDSLVDLLLLRTIDCFHGNGVSSAQGSVA